MINIDSESVEVPLLQTTVELPCFPGLTPMPRLKEQKIPDIYSYLGRGRKARGQILVWKYMSNLCSHF